MLVILALTPRAGNAYGGRCFETLVACDPCPSELATATGEDQLQIKVVGPNKDQLEVYFHNEVTIYKNDYDGTQNLNCNSHILLAPSNSLGTFAVRFGSNYDRLKIYAWSSSKRDFRVYDAQPEKGGPIWSMKWMTPTTLRIDFGQAYDKARIIRASDADPPHDFKAWDSVP